MSQQPGARIDFRTHPARYRHWRIDVTPPVARLILDVDEAAGLLGGYELKLNSYDLGVDIELADAIERLRFEHPEVGAVLLTSGKDNTFCAGANIRMLAAADHYHKVNFCKFTNETRNAMEDASRHSGQRYLSAINATAAGGGYELALATDEILLIDDGRTAVSLPEVALLAVLPGTGGLTRLVDKRRVRRDVADRFCTLEEGYAGARAVAAGLVDEAIPRSRFAERCEAALQAAATTSDRPADACGVPLPELDRQIDPDRLNYRHVTVELDRAGSCARLAVLGPEHPPPADATEAHARGAQFWPLAVMRELDDALLELRFNEPTLGTVVLSSTGDPVRVLAYDALLTAAGDHWFLREVVLLARRVLKRLELSARSLFALVTPGSCFAGFLAELVLAADQSLMLDGEWDNDANQPPATLTLGAGNFGAYASVNGLARLETRFLGDPAALARAREATDRPLQAREAAALGLVTEALDDIDWDDEVRQLIEQRAALSPDALTGMEANLRFPGPETLESKIFARLSAWQNWVFQRPNATGPEGALPLYGSGRRPDFDPRRT